MKTFYFIAILCAFFVTAYAATVTIYNDSPFPLTAIIVAADGGTKGSMTVTPQHSSVWSDPSPTNAVYSQTPYTVIFKCKNGSEFGVASGVSQGAWVSAMQSSGKRFCEPEKKNNQSSSVQQGQQSRQLQTPQSFSTPPDQQHDLDLGPP